MTPFPVLFLVVTGLVLAGLAWHALATYGHRQGGRLLLALAALGLLHELACPNGFYIVQMRGFRPFGIPLGVSAGWVVAALLGLDFARRTLGVLTPRLVGRLVPTVLLAALFASQLSNAIEPVGQISNWWIWTAEYAHGEFPHLASGMWFLTIYFVVTIALTVAGLEGRRVRALAVMTIPYAVLSMLPVPAPVAVVGLGITLVWATRARALVLDGTLSAPLAWREATWSELVPLGATFAILATLAFYALRSPQPEVVSHALGVALLGVAPHGVVSVRRLAAAVAGVRARHAADAAPLGQVPAES